MSNSYNKALSEALLRQAVIDDHTNELDAIPPAAELRRMYAFSARHEVRMRALFKKEKRKERGTAIFKAARRVAVLILATCTLLFGAFLTNAEVRAAVHDTIVEWFEKFTRYSYNEDIPVEEGSAWELGYLPEGYAIGYIHSPKMIDFENAVGDIIAFQYSTASSISFGIDNEHSTYEIVVNDEQAYNLHTSISDDYPSYVVWQQDGYAFCLDGYVSSDELLKMAYSITKK